MVQLQVSFSGLVIAHVPLNVAFVHELLEYGRLYLVIGRLEQPSRWSFQLMKVALLDDRLSQIVVLLSLPLRLERARHEFFLRDGESFMLSIYMRLCIDSIGFHTEGRHVSYWFLE